MRYQANLSNARAALGIRPLNAHGAQGVGAVARAPLSLAHLTAAASGRMSPAASAMYSPTFGGGLTAPANATRPSMHVADRSEWAKIYMAIEVPVNSDEFAAAGVLPGATLQMKPSSQVTVWITDFTVDTDEPCDFIILQLKISRVDLIGGSGGIPASRFRQNSRRPQINNEILNGGSFALVEIKNINKAATLSFFGSFEGLDLSKPMSSSM